MLNRLTISNFALIENLNLRFKDGYSVITGETGAGKSIILKALNLLLGERADYSVIKAKDEKCVIEAEFNITDLALEDQFKTWDIDYDLQTIIRREFLPSGKSRLFINDTPTTLNTLKELGSSIIKIHTQHETLDLFDKQFQLDTLDAFVQNNKSVSEYRALFANYQADLKRLQVIETTVAEQKKAQDYTQFLIDEFNQIDFKDIDIDSLLEEAEQFNNWETIQNQLTSAYSSLSDEQFSPSATLKRAIDALGKISHVSTKYLDLLNRFKSVKIEIDDIETEIGNLLHGSDLDEERMVFVQNKVQIINSLLYKHNSSNGTELRAVLDGLESEVHSFADLESEILTIKQSLTKDKKVLTDLAKSISNRRKAEAKHYSKAIHEVLKDLGMVNAELQVDFIESKELTYNGIDQIQFLFKTNLGGDFLPISKTASGGELSRLMLSVLSIIANVQKLPTLIFDEIDTGVSGEIASKMANLFAKLGQKTQLISISHLPQIASKAAVHFHVYKTVTDNTTYTMVKELSNEERIHELAKMMSGENVSEKAIENAKLLLAQ
ncbi:MAG: DNA repair protein RecN [Putridiphycobacter sp.]|nr:DNA repair protein RecN [Putridiphycobacter sp.]